MAMASKKTLAGMLMWVACSSTVRIIFCLLSVFASSVGASEPMVPTQTAQVILKTPQVEKLLTIERPKDKPRGPSWLIFGDNAPDLKGIVFSPDYEHYLYRLDVRSNSLIPDPLPNTVLTILAYPFVIKTQLMLDGKLFREFSDSQPPGTMGRTFVGDGSFIYEYASDRSRRVHIELVDNLGNNCPLPDKHKMAISLDGNHVVYGVQQPNGSVFFYDKKQFLFISPAGDFRRELLVDSDRVLIAENRLDGVYVNDHYIGPPGVVLPIGGMPLIKSLRPKFYSTLDWAENFSFYNVCSANSRETNACVAYDAILNGKKINSTKLEKAQSAYFSKDHQQWVVKFEPKDVGLGLVDIESFRWLFNGKPFLLQGQRPSPPVLGNRLRAFMYATGEKSKNESQSYLVVQWEDGALWKSPIYANSAVEPLGFGRNDDYIAYAVTTTVRDTRSQVHVQKRLVFNASEGPTFTDWGAVELHPQYPVATYLATRNPPPLESDRMARLSAAYSPFPFLDRLVIGDQVLQEYDEYWPPRFLKDRQSVVYAARKGREIFRVEQPFEVVMTPAASP